MRASTLLERFDDRVDLGDGLLKVFEGLDRVARFVGLLSEFVERLLGKSELSADCVVLAHPRTVSAVTS